MGPEIEEMWRKSSQWKVLIRKHAEMVVNDTKVYPSFEKYCYADDDPDLKRCISDLTTPHVMLNMYMYFHCAATEIPRLFGTNAARHYPSSAHESSEGLTGKNLRGDCEVLNICQCVAATFVRRLPWVFLLTQWKKVGSADTQDDFLRNRSVYWYVHGYRAPP